MATTSNHTFASAFSGITIAPTAALTGTASTTGSGLVGNVLPTSDAAFAFVTYTGTGGVIPQFNQASDRADQHAAPDRCGRLNRSRPVSAVISSDNQTLYVGTSGDNVVHRLARGANGFTDTTALPPLTPGSAQHQRRRDTPATPDLLVQRPRKATS